ncbi:MAG TPA: NAD(P)/FAD-dependent oxidoreductase [Gemmatimonadaceae bacterium]|nr:NAD(P)/FAD-dependent oxidoreductase [Gemmatimonadaceae bacterium]
MRPMFDVAIVGGGPAGLSAAIWLARYLHSVVLIDSGDPRNWETRGVNGFLGLPHIRPANLRALGREECRWYGVELVDDIVVAVGKASDDKFSLQMVSGEPLRAQRLLLAIGIRDVWPDIPGLDHTFGQNAHVCPDCDGYEARGKKIVVIGNGRRAVGMALNLTTWTRDIIICTNGQPSEFDLPEYCEKLDALNIPVLTQPILRVVCEGHAIHSLELADGMQLDAEKIFLAIGQFPADDAGTKLSLQLGCERDDEGHVVIDGHYHTSVQNVYAAGDIVPGPQLAIAGASDGAFAALAIHKSLVPENQRLAPRDQALTTSGA